MGGNVKQPMFCCVCGREFMTDFTYCGGDVCGTDCKKEFEWRKTLYILRSPYHKRGTESDKT